MSDEQGKSLYDAALRGNTAECENLLNAGIPVNWLNIDYRSIPLHESARYGRLDTTRLLLQRGATVNAENIKRKTPLMFALLADATKDMVELLLDWGAMTSTPEGQSVLDWVTGSGGSVSEEVKALLTDPLMTSSTASDGLGRALFHAALYGYRDQCATLLDNGAPVNWINTDWRSIPLHESAKYGHFEVSKLLLEKGAEVNLQTYTGKSPLMVALGKGAGAEMVQLLIDFGATTSTSQGQGLADWVTGTGVSVSDEVKALLTDAPAKITTVKKADEAKKEIVKNDDKEIESDEEPADIFLSYEWDSQTQVSTLYKVLTDRGYSCWMDIDRMGGGKNLYEEIDKGLRACKLVLSCLTASYCQSKNCRREVATADLLNKTIIPLRLEKIAWPPKGPMGIIFSQKLYVKFSEEEQESWDGQQMELLLGDISKYV